MPMHDWTRVDPNPYHHFHGRWIYAISDALNNGGLPHGYYAFAEQVTPPVSPDVLTLEMPPGGNGPATARNGSVPSGPGVMTITATPPRVRFTAAEAARPVAPRAQRRLQVRHNSTHRVVALIEIVSPANKASARDFRRFVEKAVDVLRQGLHLLVIDPFPPTPRDPNGIHAAIWKALTKKPFVLPPDKPLTLASYEAEGGDYYAAYVEPIAVGDELPVMPLFLGPETYVNVPLEPAYRQAWDGFPEFWRAVVRGELSS
jgi:hypothetical protein